MDKSELEDIIKVYETVSSEVSCLILELKLKFTNEKIEVLTAKPIEVLQNGEIQKKD